MKTTKNYKLHSSARPIKCIECRKEFSALWGRNVVHALSGAGVCSGCKKRLEAPKPIVRRSEKKVKEKDGTKTGPVQDKGG